MKLKVPVPLTLILLVIAATSVNAQQEPQFTQYMFYNMSFNPGVAGNDNAICVQGANRYQWTGFKDVDGNRVAPETFFITVDAPIRILRGGLSLMVMQDKIGYQKDITVKFGYAYQKRIGFGKLGIGAQFQFNNRSLDFGKLTTVETDPLLEQLGGEESDMLIDFSLGLFYRVPGSYYIGLSGVNLIQNKGSVLTEGSGYELRYRLDRTIYLTAGYELVFPRNPAWEFLPSVLFKTNLSAFQMDVAGLLRFKNMVWGGVSYRIQDAVGIIVGGRFKDFRLGYSYDINISKLKLPVGGGSHEIMLSYCFKLEIDKGRKSYKNTRFL